MDKEIDPSDIGKHPKVIKMAQQEMTYTDVLVCGKCHNVFHFVELFNEHKDMGCAKESGLRDCRETKPKVWAFLLWKASQLSSEENANVNSWKLYQTWVKMDEALRETWVVAGRTIQSFGRMGQGNLQEMPVKITKTVIDSPGIEKKENIKKPIIVNRPIIPPLKPTIIQNRSTPKPTQSRIAKRTTSENIQDDENVEKILAKRFNPRKKQYEYLVKWENYTHEQNTWEQLTHFDQCKHLLEHFEEQLARQKEQRAKFQQMSQLNNSQKSSPTNTIQSSLNNSQTSPTRPVRNSKAKAMDQVKQWLAADDDSGNNAMKRKHQSSADEEDEEMTDDPDDDFGFHTKKIKTDNPAVQQALIKAGQTGNVRIVQVNKSSSLSPNKVNVNNNSQIATKVINGTNNLNENKNSAEIVIAKDGKTITGIVKKPGIPLTQTKLSTASEAKIRVLAKGETVPSGVVRITQNDQTKTITKITQQVNKPGSNVVIKSANPVKPSPPLTTTQRIVTKQQQPPPKLTQVAKPNVPTKRFSLSPEGTSVHNKTTITRIVKSVPNSAKTTPETHKSITYRSSDGKLMRRNIPIHNPKEFLSKDPFNDGKDDDEESDDHLPDPFPAELPPPEPDSPPLPLTLCPITGKVLQRAEGEKTPPSSPDPVAETANEEKPPEIIFEIKSEETPTEENQEQNNDDMDSKNIQQLQPMTNEDGSPLLVTGDDGTIYQIAGKNEEGQTILIAQGSDGEQQCVYVAAQDDDDTVLTLDGNEDGVAQLISQQEGIEGETQYILKQDGDNSNPAQTLTLSIEGSDSQDGQITAEVVQAELPSPGGTRRVVLLLPDGNFMMTEVDEEQYRSLNLVS